MREIQRIFMVIENEIGIRWVKHFHSARSPVQKEDVTARLSGSEFKYSRVAEALATLANSFKKIMHFEVQQGAQLRP